MKRILGTAAAVTIGILAANTVTVAAEELEQPGQDAAVTPLDSAGEISPEMTLQDDDGVSGNPGEGSMPAGSGFSDTETDSTTDKEDGKSDEIRPDSSLEGTGVQNQPDDEAKETEDLQTEESSHDTASNSENSRQEEALTIQRQNMVTAAAVHNSDQQRTSFSQEKKELDGIDVSHWQHDIDLNKVEADFILCKASGGKGYTDPDFRRFADTILNSGRLLGFYHFAQDRGYAGNALEEAEHFYSVTRDYIGKGIPVLDWEGSAMNNGPSWAKSFLDRYYALTGVKCLIYMSASATRSWNWQEVSEAGYRLWLAQYAYDGNHVQDGYADDPWSDGKGTGSFDTVQMHQYSSGGKLSGYSGRLDMNKFYGARQDWIDLCQSTKGDVLLYRLYNRVTGGHLYTLSAYERDALKRGDWNYEGIAWRAPYYSGQSVYRMYNRITGDHHYTTSVLERDSLRKGDWNYEGIAWYSSQEAVPVYRLYNPAFWVGSHHFTTSLYEYQALTNHGWKQEGIAWFGCPELQTKTAGKRRTSRQQVTDASVSSQNNSSGYFRQLMLRIPLTQTLPVSDAIGSDSKVLSDWSVLLQAV